jgi:hypothetical protein
LEDAYVIPHGEIAVEVGQAGTLQWRGSNQGMFLADILYGGCPNLQVEPPGDRSAGHRQPSEVRGSPR